MQLVTKWYKLRHCLPRTIFYKHGFRKGSEELYFKEVYLHLDFNSDIVQASGERKFGSLITSLREPGDVLGFS
jgi:hypothetical protein